jgi:predicted transcriptional regulator
VRADELTAARSLVDPDVMVRQPGMCYKIRMSNTLTIRLTAEEKRWLEAAAKKTGKTRSAIIHEQLRLARSPQKFRHLVGAIRGGADDVSEREGFSRK